MVLDVHQYKFACPATFRSKIRHFLWTHTRSNIHIKPIPLHLKMKVLAFGASKNIGYLAALRLLRQGHTVIYLLRKPEVFDNDQDVLPFIKSGKAHTVKGDALVREQVANAWSQAAAFGNEASPVDMCIFTVGGTPSFSLTRGAIVTPPNLVTSSIFNVVTTMPSPRPKLIAITSTGLTKSSHNALPLAWKPLYSYLLPQPHEDKCGVERVLAHCAGWEWNAVVDGPSEAILPNGWERSEGLPAPGTYRDVVVIRPAFFIGESCRADQGKMYRIRKDTDLKGSYSISRADVAHFIVEGVAKNWDEWAHTRVHIAN